MSFEVEWASDIKKLTNQFFPRFSLQFSTQHLRCTSLNDLFELGSVARLEVCRNLEHARSCLPESTRNLFCPNMSVYQFARAHEILSDLYKIAILLT